MSDDVRYPELEDGETPDEADAKQRKRIKDTIKIEELNKLAGLEDDGSFRRAVTEANEAQTKMPWQKVLFDWLKRTVSGGWDRPQNVPVFGATGLFSVGRGSKRLPEIAFIIDSSGSMADDVVSDGVDQLEILMRQYKPKKTHVICCSTDVELDKTRSYNPNQLIDRSIITGGGGTRFIPAFEYVKSYHPNVDIVVYVTDGHSSDRNRIPPQLIPNKLLWVSYGMDAKEYSLGRAVNAPLVR